MNLKDKTVPSNPMLIMLYIINFNYSTEDSGGYEVKYSWYKSVGIGSGTLQDSLEVRCNFYCVLFTLC